MASLSAQSARATTTKSENNMTVGDEEGTTELLNIFKNLDRAAHRTILHSTREFAPDITFRQQLRYKQPFRFIDLPAELRVQIARYALADGSTKEWRWLVYTPTKVVGTFRGLTQVSPLCQVSRQVNREMRAICWNVNDFAFTAYCMNYFYPEDSEDEEAGILGVFEAYEFFLRGISTEVSSALRSVIFSTDLEIGVGALDRHADVFRRIHQLSQLKPHVQIKVTVQDWILFTSYDSDCWLDHCDFLTTGFNWVDELDAAGFADRSKRAWKLFPLFEPPDQHWLESRLDESDVELALDWFNNGI